jgi:predicted AAA+ superfamily ATPase
MIERMLNLPKNKNIFLFGPRLTGKSTLIEATFKNQNSLYYNLLLSDTYRKLIAHPEIFRQEILYEAKNKTIQNIIVDEIQRIPELLNEIHYLIELKIPINFIMSGSGARKLKRSHANMLGGRALTYNLFPFCYSELKESFKLDTVLRFGALPLVHLANSELESIDILRSYVDTYIKEEIELEANLRNLAGFLRFLSIASDNNGDLINYSNIARETSVNNKIIREYYKILEDTLVGFFLFPYNKSLRKRLATHPKFYFFDLGVVRAINKKTLVVIEPKTYEYGRAFEHFIILELIRLSNYKKMDLNFSFYRTEAGAEVDLIIETPFKKIFAIEIKATDVPASNHLSGLKSFIEVEKKATPILVCQTQKKFELDNILIMPWQDILEYNFFI